MIIFSLFILITKISIDHTFDKLQCSHIENTSQNTIIFKVEKI